MECGISTACLYPRDTAESLRVLCELGTEKAEIFLNTFQELEPAYVARLQKMLCGARTRACSLHPFASSLETFFFASDYHGRLADGLRLYQRYFEICRLLHIPRVVFHGDHLTTPYPFEKHCANYALLRRTARSCGVEFCQENVVRCKCGQLDFIRRMREYTDDDVSFVLDVKQQRRAGVSLWEMMDAMQGKISHIHLSGETAENDCVTPDENNFPLREFLTRLARENYTGDMVIELYQSGYAGIEEVAAAAARIGALYAEIERELKTGGEERT